MMKQETWLADAVQDFVNSCFDAGLTDYHTFDGEHVEFDELEAMVDDMFTYEQARIAEAIEASYEQTLSSYDVDPDAWEQFEL